MSGMNRMKLFFQDEVTAPLPSFPSELTAMGLYHLIHQMEADRQEMQETIDGLLEENARLTQLLNGK